MLAGVLQKKLGYCCMYTSHPAFWPLQPTWTDMASGKWCNRKNMAMRVSHFWSYEEIELCLSVMKEILHIHGTLDRKKHTNADLFKSVVYRLQKAVFPTCTVQHVKSWWKILRKHVYVATYHNKRSGTDPAKYKFHKTTRMMATSHVTADRLPWCDLTEKCLSKEKCICLSLCWITLKK